LEICDFTELSAHCPIRPLKQIHWNLKKELTGMKKLSIALSVGGPGC